MGTERLEKITLYARINGQTVRHGLEQKWHTNSSSTSGQLHWEKNYKDGLQDGVQKYWYENGKLMEEGMYEQKKGLALYGKIQGLEPEYTIKACKTGLWKKWYINGQLMEEGNYITTIHTKPKRDGFWKYWHKNGQLKTEGNYIEGKKDGLWKLWEYKTGKLRYEKNYKDGIVIE
jgi:antitoxin component YwqK of YwqJK toxin-antitoxin module